MKADQTGSPGTTAMDALLCGDETKLRRVVLCLARAQRTLGDGIKNALAPERIRLIDWLILGELTAGPSSLSALSMSLTRDPGSLSRAVNHLVLRQLVTSLRLKHDRRRTLLALTVEGSVVHWRLSRHMAHLADTSPSLMGQRALAELHSCLEDAGFRAAPSVVTSAEPSA